MDTSLLSTVQGELERLFDLDGMLELSRGVLGFDPQQVGSTGSPGAYARALVNYCSDQEALPALVDAMMYAGQGADPALRGSLSKLENGELAPGTKVGDLQVVKKIGEGGLSMVYLAEQKVSGDGPSRRAALKVIRPEFSRDRAAVHRFTTAARFLQQVHADGLAPIVGVGQLADARPWVAAEYMAGQTLAERLQRSGALHINEALPLLRGVLHGLAALHRSGIVHADIKVENVFVNREEGQREPTGVLVDAGADRLLSRRVSNVGLTGLLPVIGTAKAVAPEQARGREPDARSDLYAMGTLIYEVVTGRPPFQGDSAIDVIALHLSAPPDPPSQHARKGWVSKALDGVVLKALSKSPEDRYQSADDLLAALEDAVRRPSRVVPLDEAAFARAREALIADPHSGALASEIEELVQVSEAWPRAIEAFGTAAAATADLEAALTLLFRSARICEMELRDPLLTEQAYQEVLQRDADNTTALRGIADARRKRRDFDGLIEMLLECLEREDALEARQAVLKEVAGAYEQELHDQDNALVAWLQVLVSEPTDSEARRSIVRLAKGHDARWHDVMETLSSTVQDMVAALDMDEDAAREQARGVLAEASEQLEQYQSHFDGLLEERKQQLEAARAAQREAILARRAEEARAAAAEREARAQARQQAQKDLAAASSEQTQIDGSIAALEQEANELQDRLDALETAVDEQQSARNEVLERLELVGAEAEDKLNAYEALEASAGSAPTPAQAQELNVLAGQAEALVEQADQLEKKADELEAKESTTQGELEQVRGRVASLDGRRSELSQIREAVLERALAAQAAIEALPAEDDADGDILEVEDSEFEDVSSEEAQLTAEEQSQLDAAKVQVSQAQAALDALTGDDQSARLAQLEQDKQDLIALSNLQGGWFAGQMRRPDLAMACFGQVLSLEPDNDQANDAIADIHRGNQAWSELVELLLERAEVAVSPVKARDYRAEAALVMAEQLGDLERAQIHFDAVLQEDPAHERAQDALAGLLAQRADHTALAQLLERRVEGQMPEQAVETRLTLAELCEQHLGDPDKAQGHYEAILSVQPDHLKSLKGLERLYAASDDFERLLANLAAQADVAATPKQRIGLLERIGALLEQEFVDLPAAADNFEAVVAIDPGHEVANTALARLYRQLSRFEDLVQALERHAGAEAAEGRKIELLLQAERVLAVELGESERAMEVCERILAIDERHPEALTELARLKATSGQRAEAVRALVRLSEHASEPGEAAEHLLRAARLQQDAGELDEPIDLFKRALAIDPHSVEAVAGLQTLYSERGDAHGTVEMLRLAIPMTEGDLKRAGLYAELGTLLLDAFDDVGQARDAFLSACALEGHNAPAAMGLGRLAFRESDYQTAAEYLAIAMGRVEDLEPTVGAELCSLAGSAHDALGDAEQALAAYKRARQLQPDSREMSEQYAAALERSGAHGEAADLYRSTLERFDEEIDEAGRSRLLIEVGKAYLQDGQSDEAASALRQAFALRPDDLQLMDLLIDAETEAKSWDAVVNLLQQRGSATGSSEERYALLVRTGDVFLDQLKDEQAAAQTYMMALELQPESRNLLSKLMALYSDTKDWPRLIEVILRIAELVDDKEQLAKYYTTAGTIAQDELGRFDEAANYFLEAIAAMPVADSGEQFDDLVECLTQNQDWDRLERCYETRIARFSDEGAEGAVLGTLMDRRAEVLRDHLDRTAEAMHLFEEAQRVDPGNEERRDMLTAVYTREPKRYFQQAVAAHRELLVEEPQRIESLQALRKIYTSGKKPDESWCLCQALRCMQAADVDEEKFFKKYRLTRLAKVKSGMDERVWHDLVIHPEQDGIVTGIFASLSPAIFAVQGQALQAFGVSEADRVQPATASTAMGRMIHHAGEAMGLQLPEVYYAHQDTGGLSFLFTSPPAIGIGQGAIAGGPQQALAFVAARHLSYFRAGHAARQLVPTGTGLRAWVMASIRQISPNLPVPPSMQVQVAECEEAIKNHMLGPQREALRSLTQKLLDGAPELDTKRWMAGVDLTADRIGFVLSNDLKIACAVIDASPESSSVIPREDRIQQLLSYSISEPYFELRKRMGIALGG
ncbi:MAG: protein kinase [Myxococcales bacterium]|nr:protein kinase [Myxococcales bacterium]MDD9968048.1 protein kinase [Myxococcales bacterium]